MKPPAKTFQLKSELSRIQSGQACPMPARGAMGSAILTIIL